MHDLLAACKTVILDFPIWQPGSGQFANIQYCRYCHYSMAHAHGQDCIVARLERAAGEVNEVQS